VALRAATICSMRSSIPGRRARSLHRVKKHVREPVWQATPSWCTWTSSVSASQSA
jgi:hypothetical protein